MVRGSHGPSPRQKMPCCWANPWPHAPLLFLPGVQSHNSCGVWGEGKKSEYCRSMGPRVSLQNCRDCIFSPSLAALEKGRNSCPLAPALKPISMHPHVQSKSPVTIHECIYEGRPKIQCQKALQALHLSRHLVRALAKFPLLVVILYRVTMGIHQCNNNLTQKDRQTNKYSVLKK